MAQHFTINQIEEQLQAGKEDFLNYCSSLSDEQFFNTPEGKWSAAQQVKHLIIAINASRLAFTLPKLIVRLIAGKPNRPSRTYDELVAKYKLKLEQGGRANGRFVPPPVHQSYGKQKLLKEFDTAIKKIAAAIKKNWKETPLDNYLSPHPLLGKITLRELCYFSIYHTLHHLNNIQKAAKL